MRGTMMDFPLSLHHIFERGTTLYPDQEIVTGGAQHSHRYTYRDFAQRVRRLANALCSYGVKPGDRVASFGWNHYRHLELYFAVPMIGAVLHTVNIRLFHDDISYIVGHAADRLLFADRSLLPVVEKLRPSLTTVERVVSMDDGSESELGDATDYEEWLAAGGESFPFPHLDEDDAAMLCYTSGTTGMPKGVAYSHRALVLHAFGVCMVDSLALSQRETVMPVVPMFHATAWGLPYGSTFVGAKQVFPGVAPQPRRLLSLVQDERVTFSAGVPTIWMGLQSEMASGAYNLSTLKRVAVGGSAAPASLIAAYDRLGISVQHAWGMTELTPIGTICTLKPHLDDRPEEERLAFRAKQGLPVPGIEAKTVDANGEEVAHDGTTMGDLLVRGAWVAGSYYENPEVATQWTADGWFRTGDVATIDAEGYVEIVDRTKDLIKSGGEWISSVALENALMAHAKVREAAVIAIPHERWLERPMACVVVHDDAKSGITEAELSAYLREQFASWWLPDHFTFLDEIPKTSVGKFDKKVLRARFGAEAAR
jgi:fatty-acyl-CoA synthase